jgi:DNA helicase-2/ATP-dependent DNA helicase PcrA
VLGDPLQSVFGFNPGDGLVKWHDVCHRFPLVGKLNRPWRWINASSERLGMWLLDVREYLVAKKPVDLRRAPEGVHWIELDGSRDDHVRLANAARLTGKGSADGVLVIGDSRNPASRHQLASIVQGSAVVEPVDLGDMVDFLRTLELSADHALNTLIQFAEGLMTAVRRPELLRRIASLEAQTARKEASEVERTILTFQRARSPDAAASILSALSEQSDTRVFRPTVLRTSSRALILAASEGISLHDAAIRVREQNRMFGRPLPKRAIGSTLLLKGLEAEVAVVLNADELDARNLYVAMTRGSKSLTLCSSSLRQKGSGPPKIGLGRTKNQQLAELSKCHKGVFPQPASVLSQKYV